MSNSDVVSSEVKMMPKPAFSLQRSIPYAGDRPFNAPLYLISSSELLILIKQYRRDQGDDINKKNMTYSQYSADLVRILKNDFGWRDVRFIGRQCLLVAHDIKLIEDYYSIIKEKLISVGGECFNRYEGLS